MQFIRAWDEYMPMFVPETRKITVEGLKNLADSFLRYLGKIYDLRKGKDFDKKKGNCAWFTQEFFQWCENNRIPMGIIYFPETDKAKDAHIAPFIGEYTIDFAHKQFSKDPKEMYKIAKIDSYKKYGYNPDKAEIMEQLPDWAEGYPLDQKK